MLVESELGGLGVAIDLVAQRKIFPNSLDLEYYKAFVEVLNIVKKFVVLHGEHAEFTFDISTENEYNAGLLYAIFREDDPEMFEHFAAKISFVPAKECPRVQVGDLVAFEAMKVLDHTVGPKKRRRDSWEALRATERFETIAYGEDWFSDLKRNLGELEKKVGFNQRDYENWLKKKKRQHNKSNVFHFTNWIAKRDRKKS